MGQIETELLYMGGANQYQDPGLEPERREEAIAATKEAIRKDGTRDVFRIDADMREAESALRFCRDPDTRKAVQAYADTFLEEMMSHGDIWENFCGSR